MLKISTSKSYKIKCWIVLLFNIDQTTAVALGNIADAMDAYE